MGKKCAIRAWIVLRSFELSSAAKTPRKDGWRHHWAVMVSRWLRLPPETKRLAQLSPNTRADPFALVSAAIRGSTRFPQRRKRRSNCSMASGRRVTLSPRPASRARLASLKEKRPKATGTVKWFNPTKGRQLDVGQHSKRDWDRGSAAHFWRCLGCFAICSACGCGCHRGFAPTSWWS